jgi:hypothetical protein
MCFFMKIDRPVEPPPMSMQAAPSSCSSSTSAEMPET